MLLPLCIRGPLRRDNDVADSEVHRAAIADVHALHVAVQVARGKLKELDRAVVHVHPDGMAVRAMHLLVHVHHRLREVVSGRKLAQAHRIPERAVVDHYLAAGCELIQIDAEHCGSDVRDRQSWLGRLLFGDDHYESPGDRAGMRPGRDRDAEALTLCVERCADGNESGRNGGDAADASRMAAHRDGPAIVSSPEMLRDT